MAERLHQWYWRPLWRSEEPVIKLTRDTLTASAAGFLLGLLVGWIIL